MTSETIVNAMIKDDYGFIPIKPKNLKDLLDSFSRVAALKFFDWCDRNCFEPIFGTDLFESPAIDGQHTKEVLFELFMDFEGVN